MALIEVKDLYKIYNPGENEVRALDGVSLTIDRGEFVAIIGHSGSGKSTFMNMLGLLDVPTSGEYKLDGHNTSKLSDDEMSEIRNKEIGFIFQGFNLISSLTAQENVELPLAYRGMPKAQRHVLSEEALKRVGLEKRMNHLPKQMSGGQQQRVAIAIALANNPKILLADEPTGAVDSKTSNMIQDLFRKLNEELGITIIIVTHDISLANKVGRVVMIADGKISTEKIMKESYKDRMNELTTDGFSSDDSHEEFSILDKANRVQISPDMLAAAGIDSNKVKVQVVDGKVIITKE